MAQGIEYHVRAILSVQSTGAGRQLAHFSKLVSAASSRMTGAVSKMAKELGKGGDAFAGKLVGAGQRVAGDLGGLASQLASMGTALAAGLGAVAVVGGIKEAIRLNADLEASTFSVASTLQLMNRNAGDFGKNMQEGQWIMDELFERAATSPASFDQAKELFANMLPGAAQVTQDMERILDMSESALTLGIQMGGDFKQAGADLRRILVGGAGMDVRAWTEGLSTPIQELARAKYGIKSTGDAFVAEFNKMDPVKRFALVEEAVNRLGPATAAAGVMWAGLTSTVESDVQLLLRDMGRATFEGIKSKLMPMVTKGGLLDPKGETIRKLRDAASFVGDRLGALASRLMDALAKGVDYAANNWQSIVVRMGEMWDTAMRVAKLLATVSIARKIAGVGMQAAGGAAQVGAGAVTTIRALAGVLSMLGMAGAVIMPLLALAAPLLIGLGTALAAVVAVFVDRWDAIISGIRAGTVTLGPLFDALDLLWVKLVAAGQAFLGNADGANVATSGINLLVEGLFQLMGVMSLGLRVLGWVSLGFNTLTIIIQAFYLGIVSIIQGIMWVLNEAVGMLPDPIKAQVGGDAISSAYDAVAEHSKSVAASIREDANDPHALWGMADAFDQAYVRSGEGITGSLREELDNWAREGGGAKDAFKGEGGAQAIGATPKNVTNINKLVIQQDLRGSDPDRVIGAFYKALDKTVRQRTQPLTAVDSGV